jgi:hypothetical protein
LVSNGSNWFLNYTNRIDVGNVTTISLTNLIAGKTYYFAVIAYSSFGDEAPPSNEVKYQVPYPTPAAPTDFRIISVP